MNTCFSPTCPSPQLAGTLYLAGKYSRAPPFFHPWSVHGSQRKARWAWCHLLLKYRDIDSFATWINVLNGTISRCLVVQSLCTYFLRGGSIVSKTYFCFYHNRLQRLELFANLMSCLLCTSVLLWLSITFFEFHSNICPAFQP